MPPMPPPTTTTPPPANRHRKANRPRWLLILTGYVLLLTGNPGCSVVNRQYYYVPDTPHQTIKDRTGYFKMQRSKFDIADPAMGSITTSNGIGLPLLVGPPFLPVLPVGLVAIFWKIGNQFEMDLTISCNDGDFMTLAIDSNSYIRISDSLQKLHIATSAALNTTTPYLLVNGSKKIPLRVEEFFMLSVTGHSYRLHAPVRFGKIRSLSIVTGNPLLDHTLKNITFRRKKRLTHSIMGLS